MSGLFGGGNTSYPGMSDEERQYYQQAGQYMSQSAENTQMALPAIYNQMGYMTVPGANNAAEAANPEYDKLQNQITDLKAKNESIVRMGGNQSSTDSPYRQNLRQISQLQTTLSSMSPTITTGTKAPDTLRRMTDAELAIQNPELAADRAFAKLKREQETKQMAEVNAALVAGKTYEEQSRPQITTLANQLGQRATDVGTTATNVGTAAGNMGTVAGNIGTAAGNIGDLVDYNQPVIDAAKQRLLSEYTGGIPSYLQTQIDDARRLRDEEQIRAGMGQTLSPTGMAGRAEWDKRINDGIQATMLDRLNQAINQYYTGVNTTANLYGQQGNMYGQQGGMYGNQAGTYTNQGNLYAQMGNMYGNQANLIQSNMPGRYLATSAYAPSYQPYNVNYANTLSTIPQLYGNLASGYSSLGQPYAQDRSNQYQANVAAQQNEGGVFQTLGGAGMGALAAYGMGANPLIGMGLGAMGGGSMIPSLKKK